jgi:hypothetical protein
MEGIGEDREREIQIACDRTLALRGGLGQRQFYGYFDLSNINIVQKNDFTREKKRIDYLRLFMRTAEQNNDLILKRKHFLMALKL